MQNAHTNTGIELPDETRSQNLYEKKCVPEKHPFVLNSSRSQDVTRVLLAM